MPYQSLTDSSRHRRCDSSLGFLKSLRDKHIFPAGGRKGGGDGGGRKVKGEKKARRNREGAQGGEKDLKFMQRSFLICCLYWTDRPSCQLSHTHR